MLDALKVSESVLLKLDTSVVDEGPDAEPHAVGLPDAQIVVDELEDTDGVSDSDGAPVLHVDTLGDGDVEVLTHVLLDSEPETVAEAQSVVLEDAQALSDGVAVEHGVAVENTVGDDDGLGDALSDNVSRFVAHVVRLGDGDEEELAQPLLDGKPDADAVTQGEELEDAQALSDRVPEPHSVGHEEGEEEKDGHRDVLTTGEGVSLLHVDTLGGGE